MKNTRLGIELRAVARPFRTGVALALAATVATAVSGFGCAGRPKGSTPTAAGGKGKGAYIALVDLRGGAPEADAKNVLGMGPKTPSHYIHFRYRMQKLKEDADVKGVFVEFGGFGGFAKAQEVGEDLAALKAKGIPVHCYSNDWGNANYLAAAQACSKIVVSPAGEVSTIGIAGQVVYLHKFLVDTIGLSIDFLQVGKFKGAEEPLTRDGPTPEARQSLEGYLSDTRTLWLDAVSAGRPKVAKDAFEDGPYAPNRAKELGLVDAVGYADDTLDALKTETSATRAVPVFGPKEKASDEEVGDLFKVLAGGEGKRSPVVVLRATGSIAMAGQGNGVLGGDGGITDKGLGAAIAKLDGDDAVKAVVLRIDSPGGSALASDLLWHKLMKLRKKKPLIVSVGGMAASGGYYLASTGDTIFAESGSLVGSIGVVGGKIGFGPALERWGIHSETFPAKIGDEKAKIRAAAESPLVAWDDATKERILQSMTAIYDLFLSRLEEGRKKPRSAIEPHAEGRIFSGREGKNRGLVDELGGLGAALAKAREAAKLPADAPAEVYEEAPKLLEALGAGGDENDETKDDVSLAISALDDAAISKKLDALPAPFAALVRGTMPLARERVILTLPFAVEVR